MLSEMEIEAAVGRIGDGLRKYLWLQAEVGRRDVSHDAVFQGRFNGFYRVRRNADWRERYFRLMEESKAGGVRFTHVLRTLHAATGQYEASFASKLVATLDPTQPVIDRFVLENFDLRLPYPYQKDRERRILQVHAELCAKYEALLASDVGRLISQKVEEGYPGTGISDLKKVDLVLWQHRA